MKKLWLNEEKKVFLSSFDTSEMKKEEDEKYTCVNDFWRKKTYVKEEDMLLPSFKREFPEPYQVTQFYCGGTWNDYNAPFTIQVGYCNLDCRWCYVDKKLKICEIGRYFSVKEIINLWKKNEKVGVLRISGGEPFLAPEFLIELGKEFKKINNNRKYLWIDTNLLGRDYQKVITNLSSLDIPFGICGCFKGFDKKNFEFNTQKDGKLLDKQFENTKRILDNLGKNGELFFYIPEFIEPINDDVIRNSIIKFIEDIKKKVHNLAPLRFTVLDIHEYYANVENMIEKRLEKGKTKTIWFSILKEIYPIHLLWLPQYQIDIKHSQ